MQFKNRIGLSRSSGPGPGRTFSGCVSNFDFFLCGFFRNKHFFPGKVQGGNKLFFLGNIETNNFWVLIYKRAECKDIAKSFSEEGFLQNQTGIIYYCQILLYSSNGTTDFKSTRPLIYIKIKNFRF